MWYNVNLSQTFTLAFSKNNVLVIKTKQYHYYNHCHYYYYY